MPKPLREKPEGGSGPDIKKVRVEVGYGLNVSVEERVVMVGSARFMVLCGIALPKTIQDIQQATYEKGHSLVYAARRRAEWQLIINLRVPSNYAPPFASSRFNLEAEARELVRQLL